MYVCELRDWMLQNDKLKGNLTSKGIKWNFNTFPILKEFMKLWLKQPRELCISAILGNGDINDEELMNAFTEAESLINSILCLWPISWQTPRIIYVPLTPNHFLHSQVDGQLAPEFNQDTSYNLQKPLRRIQELTGDFWNRWMRKCIAM